MEAYALNDNFAKAIEAAQRGLAINPDSPSQLRKWLEDDVKQYQGKAP